MRGCSTEIGGIPMIKGEIPNHHINQLYRDCNSYSFTFPSDRAISNKVFLIIEDGYLAKD